MKYITLSDLASTIRNNLYRIPHDIDFVMGVPRSGMIVASIIAEFINVPLIDLDSFVFGASPSGGRRLRYVTESDRTVKRVLVVDDTMYAGTANRLARKKLGPFNDGYEFIYLVAYHEGRCNDFDIALEDVRKYTDNFSQIVLYEWNILQHHANVMQTFLFDMDGVFCQDPPDERDKKAYRDYIMNAIPLFIPKATIGEIVTFRLESNRKITEDWLAGQGINYNALTMFPANTWEERRWSGVSPARFKADIYNQRPQAKLFIESEDHQASEINRLTGRPVYCVSSNKMYE